MAHPAAQYGFREPQRLHLPQQPKGKSHCIRSGSWPSAFTLLYFEKSTVGACAFAGLPLKYSLRTGNLAPAHRLFGNCCT
jgi:hypothetical protein